MILVIVVVAAVVIVGIIVVFIVILRLNSCLVYSRKSPVYCLLIMPAVTD